MRASALRIECEGLVAAVATGDVTPAAADTFPVVEHRQHFRVAVQVGGGHKRRHPFADNILKTLDATLLQIRLHSGDEIVDDAVTVLHDSGAHLHVAASELHEFQRIAPGLDAADAAELDILVFRKPGVAGRIRLGNLDIVIAVLPVHDRILRHFEDKPQGDGLHGTPRVA